MAYGLARDIQTCRGHHAVLRDLLERCPAPGAKNGARVRAALHDLETVLLRHLAFEDTRLYPVLEAADTGIADRARRYREEMGDLSGRFVAFMRRWGGERAIEAEPDAFAAAWNAVRTALERRMTAEDDDLYELAEEHAS
ncbi:MAG: hemerythrin domain-containing protein [Candidatus Eremiobacteraeota bacterium]|nr:hemerythrin domain-containing protein [Candidatus Eremiobacteraeota bacterium]